MATLKESGVDWIGSIPSEWELLPGKALFALKNSRGNLLNLQLLSPTQGFGVIPQSKYEEMTGMRAVKLAENTDLSNLKTVHAGDFVISLRSFQGGFEYSEYEGVVSPAYQVFHSSCIIDDRFFKYLFKDSSFISKMNSYTMSLRDGKNISFHDFGDSLLPIPPLAEQKKISGYLDRKILCINDSIQNISNQISDLNNFKNIRIGELIFKSSKSTESVKNSHLEFVGDIPCTWDILPILCLFAERNHKNSDLSETNLLSLSYGAIVEKDINSTDGLLPGSFSGYNIVEKDDIVLRGTDLQNDKKSLRTGLVQERGIITSAYVTIRPIVKLDSRFFHYLLHTYDVRKVFYNMGNGVRQGLNYSEFSKLPVIVPSYQEQVAISDRIDNFCKAVDSIITLKKRQISALEEYKNSLVYECVTGKKEILS